MKMSIQVLFQGAAHNPYVSTHYPPTPSQEQLFVAVARGWVPWCRVWGR